MVEEINSINQILLNADAGGYMDEVSDIIGMSLRYWMREKKPL